jgi:hypothetical protein
MGPVTHTFMKLKQTFFDFLKNELSLKNVGGVHDIKSMFHYGLEFLF